MRKLSKRFFSLVLALVMVLSCTAVASAEEFEASATSVDYLSVPAGITRDSKEIFRGETGGHIGSTQSGDYKTWVHLDGESYFTIVVTTYTKCTVTVTGNYWGRTTVQSTNGSSVQRSVATEYQTKFPAGDYLVEVQFTDPNASYAFVLHATNSWYYT